MSPGRPSGVLRGCMLVRCEVSDVVNNTTVAKGRQDKAGTGERYYSLMVQITGG